MIRHWIKICETTDTQTLVLISQSGKSDIFHMGFKEFLQQRNLQHVGSLVDSGNVWVNIFYINNYPNISVYCKKITKIQLVSLRTTLNNLEISDTTKIDINANGQSISTTVGNITIPKPSKKQNKPQSKQLFAAENMGVDIIGDDVEGQRLSRVIWEQTDTIKTHDPHLLDLTEHDGEYPGIFALHIGDVDFWFPKLIDDYGNDYVAWEIEIIGAKGDVIVEDVQYKFKFDQYGMEEEGDSGILLTTRRLLKKDRDFRYIKQLVDNR